MWLTVALVAIRFVVIGDNVSEEGCATTADPVIEEAAPWIRQRPVPACSRAEPDAILQEPSPVPEAGAGVTAPGDTNMPELARIETVVFLQTAEFFSYCKAEEILRIAAIAREKRFGKGETIFDENEPADRFYCVVRGGVEVATPDAEPVEVGPLGAFGHYDILRGRLRQAKATALTDTLVLFFESEDFFDLLSNNIDIVKALFRHVMEPSPRHAQETHDEA